MKSAALQSSKQITALARSVERLRVRLDEAKKLVRVAQRDVVEVEKELKSNELALAKFIGVPAAGPGRASGGGLEGAIARGQATLAGWVRDGTLIPSANFSEAWGVSRQALEQASERGELFSMKLGNKRYYPAAFVQLDRGDVAAVCKALGRADPTEKMIFWMRKHGALRGRSAVDAVSAGDVERVVQLAEDWAEEGGLADATATS